MELIQQLTNLPGLPITGLSFLYVALPLFCLVHRLASPRYRVGILLFMSASFVAVSQPIAAAFLAASILIDYAMIYIMKPHDRHMYIRIGAASLSVCKMVILVVWLRDFTSAIPLGVTVLAVSGTIAVLEAYRREIPANISLLAFGLYCAFFPRLYAGPLYSFREFESWLSNPDYSLSAALSGFRIFSFGLFKTGMIGPLLGGACISFFDIARQDGAVLSYWMTLLAYALCLYYILSGFCDIARGIGLLFGLKLPINFNYPYQSYSITNFFDRFLITVTTMFRRILGHSTGIFTPPLMLTQGLLLGLWLGVGVPFALWGIYLAVFVLMERYVYHKALDAAPKLAGGIYTFLVVLIGFSILISGSVSEFHTFIIGMFSFFGEDVLLYNNRLIYVLQSNWLLLSASAFFAFSLSDMALKWLVKTLPGIAMPSRAAASVGILALYTALSL